ARSSDDGTVNVFFNRCRHRGATVCQQEYGNANYFRCAYHGWVYNNKGDLMGVPFPEGYGENFDQGKLGLVKAPRVGNYRGFIFGSLSPDGPSLDEHLGNARPYIDKFADQGPEGISVKAGAQKFFYDGNWKMQLENTVDGYHAGFVHASYFEIMGRRAGRPLNTGPRPRCYVWDLGNGHGVLDIEPDGLKSVQPVRQVNAGPGFNLTVFPNLALLFSQVRVIQPLAPDRTEVTFYPIRLKGVPEEVNLARLREHESFYGPASFASPDDWEMFRRCQTGFQANEPVSGAEWVRLARGLHYEETHETGARYSPHNDESSQRALYRHWKKIMAGD
ncbi:MAG TPA: aromatic ring-hydroxylating dioxygenase subunit alpha, partial [Dehalococcoidia bacterium]|nr:aromatic ring-hydroxylating dioxygenase subunit alpha [Dehalococcoidia bacterium]